MMTSNDDFDDGVVAIDPRRKRPQVDDETSMQEISERYHESCGKLPASSADSHPFVHNLSLLTMGIGAFGAVVLAEPFFVAISRDGITMQFAMFFIELLVAMLILGQAHVVRIEEVHIRIRARGYAESSRLETPLIVSVVLFAATVLIKLTASIVLASNGELPLWALIVVTVICLALTVGSCLFAAQHRRLYIVPDM